MNAAPHRRLELWDGAAFNYPDKIERIARTREEQGFDGRNFGDSQNRYGDPFVCMGVAARVTTRLGLSTGVTNTVTRHPAVMASAAGSVQAFSGGRMVIGLARGDSALAHLGMAPPPVSAFENYVRALQAYLRGEEVPFALADAAMGGRRADMATTESLNVGKRPTVSRMQWLPGDMPKVVVDVFGTGPRVIKIGALLGDRVTFAVGANPARIAWALEIARTARREAGLDPDGISYGAVVGLGIDDDVARGRARIAGVVATSSRFSFMHGQKIGPMDEQEEGVFRRVQESYDMTRHSVHTSTQASVMPDWFIDRHAITGGPDNVIARLQQIHELGIDRVACLFHGSHSGIEDQIDAAYAQFARDVIPAFK